MTFERYPPAITLGATDVRSDLPQLLPPPVASQAARPRCLRCYARYIELNKQLDTMTEPRQVLR